MWLNTKSPFVSANDQRPRRRKCEKKSMSSLVPTRIKPLSTNQRPKWTCPSTWTTSISVTITFLMIVRIISWFISTRRGLWSRTSSRAAGKQIKTNFQKKLNFFRQIAMLSILISNPNNFHEKNCSNLKVGFSRQIAMFVLISLSNQLIFTRKIVQL